MISFRFGRSRWERGAICANALRRTSSCVLSGWWLLIAAILTEKELAVFLKLAAGKSVNEVAADFCLSPSTVGTHLYHIKQKLNVQNAAELTLVAVRNGLIEA